MASDEEKLARLALQAERAGYRLVRKPRKKLRRCLWCHTTAMGRRHKYCSEKCCQAYHSNAQKDQPALTATPRTEAEWDVWLRVHKRL